MKQYCIIAAFEDTASGRNLEIYYKKLIDSKRFIPVMAYTRADSYDNAPPWIVNKVLRPITGVDHDIHDCAYARCHKSPKLHRTYDVWFAECVQYIYELQQILGHDSIWIFDAVKPQLEQHIVGPIIQVFHGDLFDIGVSYYVHRDSFKRYSRIFVTGKLMLELMNKKIPVSITQNKVRFIGRPLSEEGLSKSDVLSTLRQCGLNPTTKTILYAPSWESKNIWPVRSRSRAMAIFKTLLDFCHLHSLNLIIRPHPILLKHFNVFEVYEALIKGYSHVYLDDTRNFLNHNPKRSLNASDVLLTDFSSIATDFLLLQKPVVFIYPGDDIREQYGDNVPSISDVNNISYTVNAEEELFRLVPDLLHKKESRKRLMSRKRIANKIFYNANKKAGNIFRTEMDEFGETRYVDAAYIYRIIKFKVNQCIHHTFAPKRILRVHITQ